VFYIGLLINDQTGGSKTAKGVYLYIPRGKSMSHSNT